MDSIGNKQIEINVLDSRLAAPEAGTGFLDSLGGMMDGLTATPLELVLFMAMMVAIPLCILSIILVQLHHRRTGRSKIVKNGDKIAKNMLRLTPIAVAMAIIATPLISHAIMNPIMLDNSSISITVDKATALTDTGQTTVFFADTATSHVDIYAALDKDFDGNLGSNLLISAANINDASSTTNLSTTNNLVYTTGPVVMGEITMFDITVDITEDLPVGVYKGQIDFYGDYFQDTVVQDDIMFNLWCETDAGEPIKETVSLAYGETYTFPTPPELGLTGGECSKVFDHSTWATNDTYDENKFYWPQGGLSYGVDILAQPANKSVAAEMFIGRFVEPVDEPWYDCWLAGDFSTEACLTYQDDYLAWEDATYSGVYDAWAYDDVAGQWQYSPEEYVRWESAWYDWSYAYFYSNNSTLPVFDGMNLYWTNPK